MVSGVPCFFPTDGGVTPRNQTLSKTPETCADGLVRENEGHARRGRVRREALAGRITMRTGAHPLQGGVKGRQMDRFRHQPRRLGGGRRVPLTVAASAWALM